MKVIQVDIIPELRQGPTWSFDPVPAVDAAVQNIQGSIDRGNETIIVLRVGDAARGWLPTPQDGEDLLHEFAKAMAKFPPLSERAGGAVGAHVEVVMVPYFVEVTTIQVEGEGPGTQVVNGLRRTLETEAPRGA